MYPDFAVECAAHFTLIVSMSVRIWSCATLTIPMWIMAMVMIMIVLVLVMVIMVLAALRHVVWLHQYLHYSIHRLRAFSLQMIAQPQTVKSAKSCPWKT